MDETDELKILIAFLAASGSFILFLADEERREDEKEKLKGYFILLIRTSILLYSIKYKWPLAMCASISVVITVTVIMLTLINKEEKEAEQEN